MSTLLLPTRTDGERWYDISIDLDSTTYALEFAWNPIDSAWYLSIYDKDDAPLITERKIVVGLPLLSRFRDIRLPKGELVAIDTTGQDQEAGLTDLGARVVLLYMEQATMPAAYSTTP